MRYWIHILGAICFVLLGWFGNTVITKPKVVTNCDTITTVMVDSVSLIRAKAELNYLRSQKGNIKYVTKKEVIRDTILVGDTEFIVPHFTARIDTTFERGNYLTAKYEYPKNEFTILHKYPYVNTQIKETITEKPLFTFNHGIQVGFGYGVISQSFDTYIGYGFQLSF